jgi:hypothetical protein
MYSGLGDPCGPGFPIRKSADQSPFAGSPQLIAGCRVLHRLLSPRHPPHALCRLPYNLAASADFTEAPRGKVPQDITRLQDSLALVLPPTCVGEHAIHHPVVHQTEPRVRAFRPGRQPSWHTHLHDPELLKNSRIEASKGCIEEDRIAATLLDVPS